MGRDFGAHGLGAVPAKKTPRCLLSSSAQAGLVRSRWSAFQPAQGALRSESRSSCPVNRTLLTHSLMMMMPVAPAARLRVRVSALAALASKLPVEWPILPPSPNLEPAQSPPPGRTGWSRAARAPSA